MVGGASVYAVLPITIQTDSLAVFNEEFLVSSSVLTKILVEYLLCLNLEYIYV